MSVKGHGRAEPPWYGHSWPPQGIRLPHREPCIPSRGAQHKRGWRAPCPHPSSPAHLGHPSRPGRPVKTPRWLSQDCPQAPRPGSPDFTSHLHTHSPSRRTAQTPPAPRPGLAPREYLACQAPLAARAGPRDPAHPRPGPWGPAGRGYQGPPCRLWVLARQGSLRSPAKHKLRCQSQP